MKRPDDLHLMPPLAPLLMAAQRFDAPARHIRRTAHRATLRDRLFRWAAFGPALIVLVALLLGLAWWIAQGGVSLGACLVVLLIGATFVWVTLSVSNVMLGLLHLPARAAPRKTGPETVMTVAVLVPVYHEPTEAVMGNIDAMRNELARGPQRHRFAFFVLSDTRDPELVGDEMRAVMHLRTQPGVPVHYRHRELNTDRKVGNINDWITRWGAEWDAMVILDADSLMSGAALRGLADTMAADPDAGLIQSLPMLIGSETLFARMQEFAATIYGWLSAEGLALWAQREANFWGHNAIIRTRAFAEAARLPHLTARDGTPTLILSHDFVEAAMLRRAGWSVRFLPRPGGSYEETPATLVDYVLRDRRWCRGNMQHLRLLSARGFHPVSRFHMLHGAVAYMLSPVWLAFLIIWAALLPIAGPPDSYFSPDNPLYPVWPVWPQLGIVSGGWLLVTIICMLLVPKVVAVMLMMRTPGVARLYGGGRHLVAAALTEIVLAVLYAPILMVQQSKAVLRAMAGRPETWAPQRRGAVQHGWGVLLRFHWLEVMLGLVLIGGMGAGLLSPWLSLVTFSLIGAPALSWMSGLRVTDHALRPLRLDTPGSLRPTRVARTAQIARMRHRRLLDETTPAAPAIAAE